MPGRTLAAAIMVGAFASPAFADPILFGETSIDFHGVFGELESLDSEDFGIPVVHLGGKLAIRSTESGLGLQIDGNFNGFDLDWVDPGLPTGGKMFEFGGAAHLTYTFSEALKVGAYLGMQRHHSEFSGDLLGYLSLDIDVDNFFYGFEVIAMPRADLTVYARANVINPGDLTFSITDGIDVFEESGPLDDISGLHIGGGFRHRVSNRWTVGGDMNYSMLDFYGDLEWSTFDFSGTLAYNFADIPLSIMARVGYLRYDFSLDGWGSAHEDGMTALIRLTYRPGATPAGADGVLFDDYSLFGGNN